MNILTHPVHTGYQFDLARTGHEFYSLAIPGSNEIFWDHRSRPQPKNFHELETLADAPVKFDVILAHYELGYRGLQHLEGPLVLKEHCLRPPFRVPEQWARRITCYSFASQTAASRWWLPEKFAARKFIIGMGLDLETYGGYEGSAGRVLAVGQHIRLRENEKGYHNLRQLAQKWPITVVGWGSEEIPGGIGAAANYEALLRCYRTHQVFLNPSNLLSLSTLEAMATGMPVVTFRTLNSRIIRDGVNGLVVDTVPEAEAGIKKLLNSKTLSRRLGRNARETIRTRFPMQLFVQRWKALLVKAVYEHRPAVALAVSKPLASRAQSAAERRVAEALMGGVFE